MPRWNAVGPKGTVHSSEIGVSSVEGMRGIPGNAVYGAMKAAVISFTASLACEVGQYCVRVNALAPTTTLSDNTRHTLAEDPACRRATEPDQTRQICGTRRSGWCCSFPG